MRQRDTNLDLLRATAISLVVLDHIPQRWPTPLPEVTRWTDWFGAGVDLFFVLSGWLIGGLFWREEAGFGNIQLGRFWCRRALRTMPPYFIALAVAYAGVAWSRHASFDWRYVFFLQNYQPAIPYFRISWSLCIEEHFYLLMPLACLLVWRRVRRPEIWLLVLALAPAVCRASIWRPSALNGWGFFECASHLHCEGLILGVCASFVRAHRPELWATWRRGAPYCLAGAALSLILVETLGPPCLEYTLRYLLFSVVFVSLLVAVAERPPVLFSNSRPVFWVATASYSVYLIHLPALESSLRVMSHLPPVAALRIALDLVFVALFAGAFYWLIEVPSLSLRHRLMPGRTQERSALRDAVAAS